MLEDASLPIVPLHDKQRSVVKKISCKQGHMQLSGHRIPVLSQGRATGDQLKVNMLVAS
jgi:hypothetical protein